MKRILGVCLLGSSFGQDVFMGKEDAKDASVIIIGAGWAGMSAAHELHNAGVSFLVLEAGGKTGGRTTAIQFGHESVGKGKYTLEMGSGWVCGANGGAAGHSKNAPSKPTKNPVYVDAVNAGLDMILIQGSTQDFGNYAALYDSDGNFADTDGKIRQNAQKAYACLNRTASKASKDTTVRKALEGCGWNPKSEVEWAMDWALTVDDPGFPADQQSLIGSLPDPTYQWWGADDYFVVEQDPRGYAKVLDYMVKDTVPPGDSRVIFGQFVSNIAYNTKGVSVTTKGGKTYTADEVITTIPLGALQRNHGDLFSPALPSKHAQALGPANGFLMANLTRVILQFPTVWWDNSLNRWLSANKGASTSAASGEFSEWQNFNHKSLLPGSQILLNFMGDPQSSKYEGMSNDDVQAAAMTALRAQHPQKTIPDPVAFFMSRWSRAGGAYGAYSGWGIGMKDKAFSALMKPLKDSNKKERVRFAGEAMCDDLSGFTHGARQSGREVAAKYLYAEGKGPNPEKTDHLNLCWY